MSGELFDHLPLFEGLTSEQLQLLKRIFIPCDCYTGSVLFEQGDAAEHIFLVVAGEVTIRYKPEDGPAIIVARVHEGGVVGWSAALGSRHYTSSAVCADYSQMLRVRGADLRSLCEHHPETGIIILDRLATVIAERLRNTHDYVITLLKQGMRASVDSL